MAQAVLTNGSLIVSEDGSLHATEETGMTSRKARGLAQLAWETYLQGGVDGTPGQEGQLSQPALSQALQWLKAQCEFPRSESPDESEVVSNDMFELAILWLVVDFIALVPASTLLRSRGGLQALYKNLSSAASRLSLAIVYHGTSEPYHRAAGEAFVARSTTPTVSCVLQTELRSTDDAAAGARCKRRPQGTSLPPHIAAVDASADESALLRSLEALGL